MTFNNITKVLFVIFMTLNISASHAEQSVFEKATNWFTTTVLEDATAQFNLGNMYYTGLGVTQDYEEAVAWFTKAAEQGYTKAQYNLGWMSLQGKGVTQDYIRARMWYNIAASNGYSSAQEYRDSIAEKMTPKQIERAQEMANECAANNYKNC